MLSFCSTMCCIGCDTIDGTARVDDPQSGKTYLRAQMRGMRLRLRIPGEVKTVHSDNRESHP